jgi:hypothetical protein
MAVDPTTTIERLPVTVLSGFLGADKPTLPHPAGIAELDGEHGRTRAAAPGGPPLRSLGRDRIISWWPCLSRFMFR